MIHEVNLKSRLLVAGDSALPVPTVLRYDPADPCAVYATFHAAGDTVEWIFSRDLLYGGLTNDVGVGDVRVWPSTQYDDVIYIGLSSPEGEALIECPLPEVKAFLEFTAKLVPFGDEVVDMEAAINQILTEGW